jgi:hypothetical protein
MSGAVGVYYDELHHRFPHPLRLGGLAVTLVRAARFLEVLTEAESVTPQPAPQPLPVESKRILGIIQNNRTWPSLTDYKPLSPKQKFWQIT